LWQRIRVVGVINITLATGEAVDAALQIPCSERALRTLESKPALLTEKARRRGGLSAKKCTQHLLRVCRTLSRTYDPDAQSSSDFDRL